MTWTPPAPALQSKFFNAVTVADNITATPSGTQANSTLIPALWSRYTVVATIADSALLPPSQAGLAVTVINAAGLSMNVFPAVGETINVLGVNSAFAVASTKVTEFFCVTPGQWHTLTTA